jgi:para-nitrobenzyl esterase
LGRRLHPLGRWLTPAVGRRMQRAWLEFADAAGSDSQPWSGDWPRYDTTRRGTRVIRSFSDVAAEDPDAARRSAWNGLLGSD